MRQMEVATRGLAAQAADELADVRRRKAERADLLESAAAGLEAARQMIESAQALLDWGPATDVLLAAVAAAEIELLARRLRSDAVRAVSLGAVETSSALFAVAGDCRRTGAELRGLPLDEDALRRNAEHLSRVARENQDDRQAQAVASLLEAALFAGYGPALFTAIESFSALPFEMRRRMLHRTTGG